MDSTQPFLYQFKNAMHFGWLISEEKESNLKNDLASNFKNSNRKYFASNDSPSKHLRSSNSKNTGLGVRTNSHCSLGNLGVTVDDHGNVLIAEWSKGKVEGRYFLFNLNSSSFASTLDNIPIGVCQYGSMKSNVLQGMNFIYSCNGTVVGCNFQRGKMNGKCMIVQNQNRFGFRAKQSKQSQPLDAQVIQFHEHNVVFSNNKSNKDQMHLRVTPPKYEMSRIKSHLNLNSNDKVRTERIYDNDFQYPYHFLNRFAKKHRNQQSKIRDSVFELIELENNQMFVGFTFKRNSQSYNPINGFGLIFKDMWPSKIGKFIDGKLEGLCRIYETQMNIFDGFFLKDKMIEGFIFDLYNQQMHFGFQSDHLNMSDLKKNTNNSKKESLSNSSQSFVILKSYLKIDFDQMLQYKKIYHLKSLDYTNSYFVMPRNVEQLPWAPLIIRKLESKKVIQNLMSPFRSQMVNLQISQIELVAQSSENRIQRTIVNELTQKINEKESKDVVPQRSVKNKSRIISKEIRLALEQKNRSPSSYRRQQIVKPFQECIDEYQQLSKDKSNKMEHSVPSTIHRQINKKLNKSQKKSEKSQQKIQRENMLISKHSQQNNIKQTSNKPKIKQKPFNELISEYQNCQTQKRNLSGKKNQNQKLKEVKSKLQLIQMDKVQQSGVTSKRQKNRPASSRSNLNLHKIYEQVLSTKLN